MIALSYSAWKDADCPFRFNALRIAKTYKEPLGDAGEIGGHVATILKTYRQYCLAKNIQSDLDWLLKVSAAKSADTDMIAKIMELIEAFINTNLVNIPLNPAWVRVEGKLAFDGNLNPLPEDSGWFDRNAAFRMVADFAYIQDRTLFILDDKTGLGETDSFQTELYAFLLPLVRPHDSLGGYDRIVCVMNELGKRRADVVGEYEPGSLSHIRDKILARLSEVNSWTEYPAKVCSQCKWCSVPGCPIREEAQTALVTAEKSPVAVIPSAITTREEAEKAALFLLFTDKIQDLVKELLRAWVRENGPVYAGGKVAEERPNTPWKVRDLERLTRTLVGYGVQPAAIWKELSLSESALEKLVKRAKIRERLPMLLSMGERKEYKPRFGLFTDSLQ